MYSTRDKLLLALARTPRRALSGSTLAHKMGLTRTAVWKQVKALQNEGFAIKTHKTHGYRLTVPFDISLLAGKATPGTTFWKIQYDFSVLSTQALAKQAASTGTPEGRVWVAERQTAGRGRLDRTWVSPLGGLWFSFLLRPALAPALVPSLTLVVALALAESIQETTHIEARLKWPNDVVVKTSTGWRKIGGILTEMSAEVDRIHWVVVGIGVNVNNSLPASLANRAVTVCSLTGRSLARAVLLKAFLGRFGKAYRRFEKSGFEAFQKSYWERYSRPNQLVQLKTSQGIVSGMARDVDVRGALVVESRDQTKSIWEGEIIL